MTVLFLQDFFPLVKGTTICYPVGMKHTTLQDTLKKLPDTPGIYLFYSQKKELVYVGKATSLRNRVRSYFVGKKHSRPIEQMIHEVVDIKWKESESVLEAIILEANYIKKYKPKYNVLGRDDKSWNYIVITKDEYPAVSTIRQHEYQKKGLGAGNRELGEYKYVFGPYPGLNTKATMKLLRRMFYISDCQKKWRSRKKGGDSRVRGNDVSKPCLYRQMGLCLGVCTQEISPTEYKKKVIKPLVSFLKGGKKLLISTLNRRMKEASKQQEYEEAARLRNQIASLERIHDVALLNKSFFDNKQLAISNKQISRIEGYDISNLGSTGKVGSMVVFDTGGPVKSEYRKFKIKFVQGQSDVDCLEEVLVRRFRRSSIFEGAGRDLLVQSVAKKEKWPLPDVLLIDGGRPQVHRAKEVVRRFGLEIPIIGIAKGAARKKNEFVFGSRERWFIKWVNENQNLLIQVRDEAHRFALSYQRKLR